MPRHFLGCVCRKCKGVYYPGHNPPPPLAAAKPLPPPNPPRPAPYVVVIPSSIYGRGTG
jgi:hypothetical protein